MSQGDGLPCLKMTVQKGEITVKLSEVNQTMLDDIATYMCDEIREQVHIELAPCSPEKFLVRYLQLDQKFEELLSSEFNVEN